MTAGFGPSSTGSRLSCSVLVSEPLPEPAIDVFQREFSSVTVLDNEQMLRGSPELYTADRDVIISTVNSILDEQFFSRISKKLKIIGLYSSGYGHVDLNAAKERGVIILNTPDVLNHAVADLALRPRTARPFTGLGTTRTSHVDDTPRIDVDKLRKRSRHDAD